MKIKLLTLSLALVVMSAFAFSPRQVIVQTLSVGANYAQADLECGDPSLQKDPHGTGLCVDRKSVIQRNSVNSLVIRVIDILLAVTAIIAILFIVIGGFQYITSAGNEELAGKGKKTILNAIIGLVLVILSYAIVHAIIFATQTVS